MTNAQAPMTSSVPPNSIGHWDLVIGTFLLPHFRERNLRCLEADLRPMKAEPFIKAARAGIVRRDFEINPVDAGAFEARKRMPDEDAPQAMSAMSGRDADVLDRAQAGVGHALNRAAQLRPPLVGGPAL